MTDPSSHEQDQLQEIFILSPDNGIAALLVEQLNQRDLPARVFSDENSLNEILGRDKPGLLVYVSSHGTDETYQLVRYMKADSAMSTIPVLVLTPASTITDLLKVLESGADNFIAPPYVSEDHLSLIEGMLIPPAPLPRGTTITQFRVRQDDRTFTVAAPDRQLLEYLLSAFDAVAAKSTELTNATSEAILLSGSVQELEKTRSAKLQETERLHAELKEKEENRIALAREYGEMKQSLEKARGDLNAVTAELETKKSSETSLQKALAQEKNRVSSIEASIQDRSRDLESVKSALSGAEARAKTAEEELAALQREKAQCEHDLNQVIAGLNDTVQQNAARMARLKDEMTTEQMQKIAAENKVSDLEHELDTLRPLAKELELVRVEQEKSRSALLDADAAKRELTTLQERVIELSKNLEDEKTRRKSLEEEIALQAREVAERKEKIRLTHDTWRREEAGRAATVEQLKEKIQSAEEKNQALSRHATEDAATIEKLTGKLSAADQRIRLFEKDAEESARRKILAGEELKNHSSLQVQDPKFASSGRSPKNEENRSHEVGEKEKHEIQQSLFDAGDVSGKKEHTELVVAKGASLPVETHEPPPPAVRDTRQDLMVSTDHPVFPGIHDETPTPPREKPTVPSPGASGSNPVAGESMGESKSGRPPAAPVTGQKGAANAGSETSFTPAQWLDLASWVHHNESLTPEQRHRILRLGRLVQNGRTLTRSQQDQVKEIFSMAQSLGYQGKSP